MKEYKRLRIEAEKASNVCKLHVGTVEKCHVIVVQLIDGRKDLDKGILLTRSFGCEEIVVGQFNKENKLRKNEFKMINSVVSKAAEYLNKLYQVNRKK